MNNRLCTSAAAAWMLSAVIWASSARCQTPPDYGFEWATITHPGNPAYPGDASPPIDTNPQELVLGRGSVGYEYRIATNELSIANWTEFVNTFAVQGDFPTVLFGTAAFTRTVPLNIHPDPGYGGPGRRYTYEPWRATNPLWGIRWRDAAMFCNWLHNGKSSDPAALWGGAYDTSTWDSDGRPHTDALTHEPGARFWIPTMDEWMKAAFWDPEKQDRDGWWRYLNSSDAEPIPGRPGEPGATTSAGLTWGPNFNPQDIALGDYPDALSPWGLLDTASGNSEWLEEPFYPGDLRERGVYGANAGGGLDSAYVTAMRSDSIHQGRETLRLASAVPSPGVGISGILLSGGVLSLRRRR